MPNNCFVSYIVSGHQQTDTVGSTVITLSANLKLVPQVSNQPGHGQGFIVGVAVVQALGPHVSAEQASVSSQASNADAHVSVDGNDLLLIGRELWGGPLQGYNNCMGFALQTNSRGALFDSLHGVLDLMEATLRTPDRHVIVVLVTKL